MCHPTTATGAVEDLKHLVELVRLEQAAAGLQRGFLNCKCVGERVSWFVGLHES